jgi:type VI secretion system secreted protein Hcp
MAADMFLKLGNIKGESADEKHADEIDILAWSWGISQTGTTHTGGGGSAGKVSIQDISFTKFFDCATPPVMLACCNGKHFKEAMFTVRKAGAKPLEYIKITLTDVVVSSVSVGGSNGEDRLTENITLNFAKYKVEYTPQKKDGAAGAAIAAGWDIAKNAKA